MRRFHGRGIFSRFTLMAIAAVALAACASSSSQALSNVGAPVQPQGGADRNAAGAAAPSAAAPAGNGSQPGGQAPVDTSLKVVYTGSLQLVVTDVAEAAAKAKLAVTAVGGFIGASQESNNADKPTATITNRIPADKWDDTVTAIRSVASKVVAEQTQATEIGGQLVDLEARITNLRASEAALQKIAADAGNVSDLLQVQQQLTDIRGQIEELDAQRARLVNQVQYGTLVTTFGLEVAQVKEAAKSWDPATDVDGATATMISVGQKLVSGAIWFVIVWLPFLAVTLIVLFVAWKIGRRFGRIPMGPAGGGGTIPGWTGTDGPPKP
jgi:Ca-activated chloride channel homolog